MRLAGLFPVFLLVTACSPSPHDLAGRGDVERLEAMVDARPASLEKRNKLGKTPLFYAVTYRWPESTSLLLEKGADVNAQDITGMTPLHAAATLSRIEEATLLLEAGADLHAQDDFGDTPLHSAAIHGQTRMIAWLLERGANPRAKNNEGLIPLDLARRERKADAAVLLETALEPVVPVRVH